MAALAGPSPGTPRVALRQRSQRRQTRTPATTAASVGGVPSFQGPSRVARCADLAAWNAGSCENLEDELWDTAALLRTWSAHDPEWPAHGLVPRVCSLFVL